MIHIEHENSANPLFKETTGIFNRTFTVIVPAYNEESRITPVLREVSSFISENALPWKVIVSIDGDDGTEDIVRNFGLKYNFITSLRSGERGGKGRAVIRTGNFIDSEFVILMDADNSIHFSDLIKTVPLLNDNDVVILSRYSKQNKIPLIRRIPSRGFNLLVKAVTGLRVTDTQSGYKLFNATKFVDALKHVGSTNTFYDVSLLYHLKMRGSRITETPVAYVHDDGSQFNIIGLVIGEGVSLIAFVVRHSRLYRHVPKSLRSLYYRKFKWI